MRRMTACVVVGLMAAGGLFAGDKVKVLFLTGRTDLPYHDWRENAPYLRSVLENTGRFDVKLLEEVRGATAATLAPYDVLVLHYNGPRWGEETERAVEEFLRSGKGMFAFHGVSYGPFYGQNLKERKLEGEPWPAYAEMMGMTWKLENIGHSARHVFPVKWVDRDHPISRGLPASFLANDELYHKMDFRPGVTVLARAYSDPKQRGTGKEEPIVWTVRFGQGRVVHTSLGHDLEALSQQGFVDLFARGTEWAATGAVTVAPGVRRFGEPGRDAVRVLAVTGGHSYPVDFYTIFEGWDDIRWAHATSPGEAFRADMKDKWDVIVFHDMREEISEEHRKRLRAFVESGGGVVSLHHAIVDYTDWPWWHEHVIGGKYFTKAQGARAASSYLEGTDIVARPVQGKHPVMRGVGPMAVHDEAYQSMWHSPDITVLMDTDHPKNDPPVVYLGPNPKIRSVYIQLGHSAETFHHPAYRRLVHNAILWTAGRDK